MVKREVVVTGVGAVSPIGNDWETVRAKLRSCTNATVEKDFGVSGSEPGFFCPAKPYDYNRKSFLSDHLRRSIGPTSDMAVYCAIKACEDAELWPILSSPNNYRVGVAAGSCMGEEQDIISLAKAITTGSLRDIDSRTYTKIMPHSVASCISVALRLNGYVIPTGSACTSSSEAVGMAYRMIQSGQQDIMFAGGADHIGKAYPAIFDALYATAKSGHAAMVPAPFDGDSPGIVLGEGGCILVLEEYGHALRRDAKIYARVVGFGMTADGWNLIRPYSCYPLVECMRQAHAEYGRGAMLDYINAHATGTPSGDRNESLAIAESYSNGVPVSSLKGYMGHTLGACGALEAWMTIEMMREGWFSPNLNLRNTSKYVRTGDVDYITDCGRFVDDARLVMSNNCAFGGINTSLLFEKYRG